MFLAAELGITGHEVREIFLAKIYELSKPVAPGKMADNFCCKFLKPIII